ncbi:MAG TPA: ABC transporter ATP-binding protein [Burkholderiales bacterium]|jgi:NitT/TauT family transport system ATP-binding protein|nr:ABC transporter ATP-binding protein [Burkholderiales bacterium]
MNSQAIAVEVRAAVKVFANGVRALDPIDLVVREGEIVTLVGPSGCGKSTLLRLIAGLVQPSAGRIGLSPEARSAGLAFVFQNPTLMPWASVERNVRLPLDLCGAERVRAQDKVGHALELVGLNDFARFYPRELSGGMQMRASIARALVTGPRLLLMDEPFGALDEITRNRLDRDLSELCAREQLTVLYVTHSIYEAVFLSSRVLVMSARPGRIFEEVAIDEPQPRGEAFRATEKFARLSTGLSGMLATAMHGAPA